MAQAVIWPLTLDVSHARCLEAWMHGPGFLPELPEAHFLFACPQSLPGVLCLLSFLPGAESLPNFHHS